MSPRLNEECITSLSDRYDPAQATFEKFGAATGGTAIGVVSRPTDKMVEVADEIIQELGMPEKYLAKFLKRRSDYRMNSAIDDPSTRAYDDLELDDAYLEHVRESEAAQRAIDSLVSRLDDGEEITLVCYEESHERCHRHLLMEIIESRFEGSFEFNVPVTA